MSQYTFEGFYFKHQNADTTLALIPGRSAEGAFVQVVTDEQAWNIPFPRGAYRRANPVWIGGNRFSRAGVRLALHADGLDLTGSLRYGPLTPLKSDIMGPFRFLPMECRHRVVSMAHSLQGTLVLNGRALDFTGGKGYIEGDSGRSFPKQYAWVHCNAFAREASVMLSIAQIPLGRAHFWGCIGVVWLNGREYRLATYNGVRIVYRSRGRLEVAQGRHRLVVEPGEGAGHKLAAPSGGFMVRTIHENAQARARFRFYEGDRLLLDEESRQVGFEYVE